MEKPDDLVAIGSYDLQLAHIIQGALSAAGIESMVTNEVMSGIYAMPLSSLGQSKVLVFRRDYEKALEALEQQPEADTNETEEQSH